MLAVYLTGSFKLCSQDFCWRYGGTNWLRLQANSIRCSWANRSSNRKSWLIRSINSSCTNDKFLSTSFLTIRFRYIHSTWRRRQFFFRNFGNNLSAEHKIYRRKTQQDIPNRTHKACAFSLVLVGTYLCNLNVLDCRSKRICINISY